MGIGEYAELFPKVPCIESKDAATSLPVEALLKKDFAVIPENLSLNNPLHDVEQVQVNVTISWRRVGSRGSAALSHGLSEQSKLIQPGSH